MKGVQIELENGTALGFVIELNKAPLIVIKAGDGFIMCGYLNIPTANKLGEIAGRVTGVKTFDDILNAKLVEITNEARAIGISEGMLGREALELMLQNKK